MPDFTWCEKRGSFPLADFDEYQDVVQLELQDKELYVWLRLTGYDHSDALLATDEAGLAHV